MAAIGSIIGEKYEIMAELGRGKVSVVYLALDRNRRTQWAIKEVQRQVRGWNNEVVIQSALTEADMLRKLRHPALPRIVDIIESPEAIFIVMDFVPGEPLDKVLKREGAQTEEKVLEWATQLCDLLNYLHNRVPPIIIGNIRPYNIKCDDSKIYLLDISVAEKLIICAEDEIKWGLNAFAAPEMLKNNELDVRSDIYSIGANLYSMLTGRDSLEVARRVLTQHSAPYYLNAPVSAGMEAIVSKCIEPLPDNRFQSCAELMKAFEKTKKSKQHRRNKIRELLKNGDK